jgi:hypothetical protein
MYHCRIKDLRTNKIFEKDIPSYEFDAFQRKCKYSKNIKIISQMKVW